MSTILRKAPARTIDALRQIITSHIETVKNELITDHKKDIAHAQDEIEAAKINAIFHEKLGFLYQQLAQELEFFDGALDLAKDLDEEERIELIRKYFAAKRRMMANSRQPETDGDDIDLLKIILIAFVIGYWIALIQQIKRNEQLYRLAAKAGIEEFEQDLSKIEETLPNKLAHIKK